MTYIGIMEGRLLPPEAGRFQCFPREGWAKEFELAPQANMDCIEWIYDLYGAARIILWISPCYAPSQWNWKSASRRWSGC
jgi:hypothetical protein